jgi:hypothetical protein
VLLPYKREKAPEGALFFEKLSEFLTVADLPAESGGLRPLRGESHEWD